MPWPPPKQPKIYHIVHVDRLASIVADGFLWCDRTIVARGGLGTVIGMSGIKERRLRLAVDPHPGTFVGDYVPFYFCSRSIMLYVIHRGNNPELTYTGGQEPIIHLEADLHRVIAWANTASQRWAFSLSNAGSYYAALRATVPELVEINWPAVAATDFRPPEVKEAKQAEFLMHTCFPWELVDRIGVCSRAMGQHAIKAMGSALHRPQVEIRRDWYY